MTIGWHFDNTYSKLSDTFREQINPIPVASPELIILNEKLAFELDLNFSKIIFLIKYKIYLVIFLGSLSIKSNIDLLDKRGPLLHLQNF